MQNYIEKKHASSYFILFFFEKQIKNFEKQVVHFQLLYKTKQRRNLLSETNK